MGQNGYGSMSSYSPKLYGGWVYHACQKFFFKVFLLTFIPSIWIWFFHLLSWYRLPPSSTLEILIPANAVGKVMGKGGLNLANIRKVGLSLFSPVPQPYIILLIIKLKRKSNIEMNEDNNLHNYNIVFGWSIFFNYDALHSWENILCHLLVFFLYH